MYKWWILGGSLLIVSSALIFRFLIQPKTTLTPTVASQNITEERLASDEQAIEELANQLSELKTAVLESTNSGAPATPVQSEVRLQNAEQAITILQSQVNQLRGVSTTSQGTTTTKSPLYIPLGSTGSSTATDYTSNSSFQASINPDNYPGYTSMQLQVVTRVLNGNGTAYTRLYNSSSGTSILTSELSTSSSDFVLLLSQPFTLPSGSKNYTLQMKSLTGYENDIQSASIKVNF